MVIAIWGQAWVRGADGLFRTLKLGDTVQKGAMVLTAQEAIVQIAGDDTTTNTAAITPPKKTDADLAIEGINKGSTETAPAAGLGGGGGGGSLEPGLRVDRITEEVPAATPLRSAASARASGDRACER
jgi:hypothetical protein